MAGLFSTPKMPALPPPIRMPDPEDPARLEAIRLAAAGITGAGQQPKDSRMATQLATNGSTGKIGA